MRVHQYPSRVPLEASPEKYFLCHRVGFPVANVGIMEATVAVYLHSAALQWAFGSNVQARHRGGMPPLATWEH